MSNTPRPDWVRFHFAHWELLAYRLRANDLQLYLRAFLEAAHDEGRLPADVAGLALKLDVTPEALKAFAEHYPWLLTLADAQAMPEHAHGMHEHAQVEIACTQRIRARRSQHAQHAANTRWGVIKGGK